MKIKVYRQNIIDEEFMLEKDGGKFLQEYSEYDKNRNVTLEVTCFPNGNVEQKISRQYDEKNNLIKEVITDQDGEILENKTWTYDEEGKAIEEKQYYIDGSYDNTTNHYDSEGLIIERITEDDEGEKGAREEVVYENGLLIKHVIYDEDGSVDSSEENTYDEKGHLIQRKESNMEGEIEKLEITYDEAGKIDQEIRYNEHGKIIERNTYTYGENNLPSEIHEETTVKNNRARITYDSNNHVILHEVYDVNDNLINRVERNYLDNGYIKDSEIMISMPERGVQHHYRLTYEYSDE